MSSERKTLKILCFVSVVIAIACAVTGCLTLTSANTQPQTQGTLGGVLDLLVGAAAIAFSVLGIKGANKPSSAGGARTAGVITAVVSCVAAACTVAAGQTGYAVVPTLALVLSVAGAIFAHKVLQQAQR